MKFVSIDEMKLELISEGDFTKEEVEKMKTSKIISEWIKLQKICKA